MQNKTLKRICGVFRLTLCGFKEFAIAFCQFCKQQQTSYFCASKRLSKKQLQIRSSVKPKSIMRINNKT